MRKISIMPKLRCKKGRCQEEAELVLGTLLGGSNKGDRGRRQPKRHGTTKGNSSRDDIDRDNMEVVLA